MSEILTSVCAGKQDVSQYIYTNLATTNLKFDNNNNQTTNINFEGNNIPSTNNATSCHQLTSYLSNKIFASNLLSPNIFSRFALNQDHLKNFTNNITNLTNDINNTLPNNSTNTQNSYEISPIKPIYITPQNDKTSNLPGPLKPRTTPAREAVDPMKYISIEDLDGTKYACSKCGNVYKWRKSLNKHWKEKHDGEPLPTQQEREQIIKFPSQNFQKNTNIKHVGNISQKNIYIPYSISNLQNNLPSNFSNYGAFLKMENKKEVTNIHFNNTRLQTPQSNVTEVNESCFDQHGVLDLSFKSSSSSKQDVAIDYSCRQSSERTTVQTTASVKDVSLRGKKNKCMQCGELMDSLEALNDHFVIHHINQLPSISHTTSKQIGGSLKCEFKCCVCGQEEEWLCKLESHYDSVHAVISNNPYKLTNIRNESSFNSSLSIEHISTTLNSVKSGPVELTGLETIVVIPKAPEEYSSDNRAIYKVIDKKSTPLFKFSHTSDLNASKFNFSKSTQRGRKEGGLNGEINLPYQCNLCDYKARWPSEMTQHKKNHSDEKPFYCTLCPYRSKWKWDVVKHQKRCGGNKVQSENINKQRKINQKFHEKIENKNGMLKDLFSYPQINGNELIETLKLENNNGNYLFEKLGESDKGLIKLENSQVLSSFENNNNNINSNNYINNNSNNHPCEQCHFVGHSPAELRRHMRVHSNEKPFVCKSCQYSTKWKCDLKKHIKTYNHEAQDPILMEAHPRRASDPSLFKNDTSDSDGHSVWEAELSQDGYLKCKHCSFHATNLLNLVKHVKEQTCGVIENAKNEIDKDTCDDYLDKERFLKKFGLMKRNRFDDSYNLTMNEETNIIVNNSENINHSDIDTMNQNIKEIDKSNKIKTLDDCESINTSLSTFNQPSSPGFEKEPMNQYQTFEQEFTGVKNVSSDSSELTEPVESDDNSCEKLLIDEDVIMSESKKSFKDYKKNHSGFIRCRKCRFKSRYQSNVDIHAKQHIKKKKVSCVCCGYTTLNAAKMKKHKLRKNCFRDLKWRKERKGIRKVNALYRKSDQI